MPSGPAEPVQVEFTPEFKRNLRALAKKYRHIRSDVQPMIDQLRAGDVMGDQVPMTCTGVLIGIDDYHKILEDEEELAAIRAYDVAKASGDEAIPFEQAVKEIESLS